MDNKNDFVKNETKTWCPENWFEFIGDKNRRPVGRLQRCAIVHRLPLLVLLIGAYGCAKTTLARFLVKAYRCLNATADGSPCHTCDDCTRQGPDYNGDGMVYQQYEYDCHRYATPKKLQPILERIEQDDRPIVFLDQLEGLTEKALRLLLTFLNNFKGVFIAAIATDDFQKLKRAVRTMPALAPVFERMRKVYLHIPEVDEMVALFKSKAPEWGVIADDEAMLRLMVTASQRSFRTCLDILQAAEEDDPPVLDRATIEEFLTLDDAVPDEDALELDDDAAADYPE